MEVVEKGNHSFQNPHSKIILNAQICDGIVLNTIYKKYIQAFLE